jgi:hypothetical protein
MNGILGAEALLVARLASTPPFIRVIGARNLKPSLILPDNHRQASESPFSVVEVGTITKSIYLSGIDECGVDNIIT